MGLERLAASVAALFVSLAWAGCTNPPSAPSATQPTASLPLPSTTPFPTDLPPVNRSVPVYQYANCTQILMPFQVPKANVDAVVPDAFEPWGITSATAGLLVFAKECRRALDNRTVFGAVSEFWTIAFTHPKNESWMEDGYTDHYVLDYFTTSENITKSLETLGITVSTGNISTTKTPLPDSQQLWEWSVQANGFGASFHHRLHSEDPQTGTEKGHLWFGDGPFRRVDAVLHGTVDSLLNEGELVLEGDSRFEEALGSAVGAWRGTSEVNDSWTYEIDTDWFAT